MRSREASGGSAVAYRVAEPQGGRALLEAACGVRQHESNRFGVRDDGGRDRSAAYDGEARRRRAQRLQRALRVSSEQAPADPGTNREWVWSFGLVLTLAHRRHDRRTPLVIGAGARKCSVQGGAAVSGVTSRTRVGRRRLPDLCHERALPCAGVRYVGTAGSSTI